VSLAEATMSWLDNFKTKRAKERRRMQFNIAPAYDVTEFDRAVPNSMCETNGTLTRHLLLNAFAAKYHPKGEQQPQGLKGQDRKTWGRILNALTRAVEKDETSIELNEDAVTFLRRIIEDYSAPTNWCGWVVTLEEALDEVHEAIKAAKNGAAKTETATK
jgi:hypothetical protein